MTKRDNDKQFGQYLSQLAPVGTEAEETLHAIILGEADALVVEGKNGPRVYTLEGAEEPYRQLIERMSEAAIVIDDATILYCNGRLGQLLGRENLAGQNFIKLLAPDQCERMQSFLVNCSRRNALTEASLIAADGHCVAVRLSAAPISFNQRPCVALIVTALDDVEALKISEANLRESEERFRAIFEHAAIGIAITDWEGHITHANPAYCDLLGYTQEELGRIVFSELVHPEDRAETFIEIERVREHKLPFFEIESRYIRKSGQTVWVHKFVSILHDEKGAPAHLLALLTDVSERRRMEQTLREADRHKDEFIATLAHELRNPLTPIANALHSLQRIAGATGDMQRLHGMIERQVTQLVRLVEDLLEVSRISTGKIELRKQRLDLAAVIRQAVETSQPLLEAGRHDTTISLGDGPLTVDGDQVRLAQLFTNLLNNAAKYTPPGGHISISARKENEEAIVSIRDTGIGISAEMLPKVFGLFTQGDRATGRTQGGIGIGLSLARKLVELHGGSIHGFSGGAGKGSEFIVWLPLSGEAATDAQAEEKCDSANGSSCRVLVVDDDHDVADSFSMLLQTFGVDTCVVYSGMAAIDVLNEFMPRLAFVDIGMPDVDGYETARRIRELPQGKNLTLAALSGWGNIEDRRRSVEAGFDHHFVKPIDMTALESLLASVQISALSQAPGGR
jgi:PAS domain S-box-containing protein